MAGETGVKGIGAADAGGVISGLIRAFVENKGGDMPFSRNVWASQSVGGYSFLI